MRRLLIILIALVLVSVPVVGFSASQKRIALVIGNSAYKNAPLRNPANDATDMAIMLERLGFKVTLKTDANQRAMKQSIRAFGKQLAKGGVGLFYFAGHGIQYSGRNYLIPVHADVQSEADVEYEAVDAGRVLAQMEKAGNNLNIIILDACRNNPFARSFRSADKGLAKMDAPTGSILAYSTAPGSVAADGIGRNGLYTSKLLKHMATPNVKIETVFKKVRIDVARASGKKQTPWESSSLMGNFYFYSEKTVSSQPVRAIGVEKRRSPQNLNAEEELWEIVKTSAVIEDFEMFLDEYPNSRFSTHARLKIQQLKRKQNARTMTAAVAPAVVKPKPVQPVIKTAITVADAVASEGNYIKYSTGIVYDKKTNLEWYVGPDENTNWYEADKWVKGLDIGGGGWRLPTKSDLRSIYRPKTGKRNMPPLLKTTGWWVWSFSSDGINSQKAYYFRGHSKYEWQAKSSTLNMRTFAVRSRKDVAQIKSETKKPDKMYASVAPAVVDQASSNSRRAAQNSYRLAIFPLKIYASGGGDQYVTPNELGAIRGIASVVSDDDRLTLKYCYKEFESTSEGVILLRDVLRNNVWKKKSMFSPSEPDWEEVSRIGLKINANPIVMITGDVSTSTFNYYLYDSGNNKIYSKKVGSHYAVFEQVTHNTVRDLIKDFYKSQ
jgi:hypothetical protein